MSSAASGAMGTRPRPPTGANPAGAAPRRRMRGVRAQAPIYAGLLLYSLIAVFPLYWLVTSSFKVGMELIAPTPTLLPARIDVSNYTRVLSTGLFPTFFANSVKIGLLTTVFAVAI